MPNSKPIKVIIDTNLWISFLIGKQLEEYQKLVEMLDDLIDEVGEDEDHPLASLMEIIGVLIEQYETENVLELEC